MRGREVLQKQGGIDAGGTGLCYPLFDARHCSVNVGAACSRPRRIRSMLRGSVLRSFKSSALSRLELIDLARLLLIGYRCLAVRSVLVLR